MLFEWQMKDIQNSIRTVFGGHSCGCQILQNTELSPPLKLTLDTYLPKKL